MSESEKKVSVEVPAAALAEAMGEEARPLAQRVRELAEDLAGDLAGRMRRLAVDATSLSATAGAAFFAETDTAPLGKEAGQSLRELRELAGLTVEELTATLDLEDRSVLDAVEEGTATVSFELLLRLSAILARHDPIPFLLRLTRQSNPALWRAFEGVGATRLPLQYEREREFVNIFRGDDRARELSDEEFQHVLEFTRSAFSLALHRSSGRDEKK